MQSGSIFYYNSTTGVSQWDPPLEWISSDVVNEFNTLNKNDREKVNDSSINEEFVTVKENNITNEKNKKYESITLNDQVKDVAGEDDKSKNENLNLLLLNSSQEEAPVVQTKIRNDYFKEMESRVKNRHELLEKVEIEGNEHLRSSIAIAANYNHSIHTLNSPDYTNDNYYEQMREKKPIFSDEEYMNTALDQVEVRRMFFESLSEAEIRHRKQMMLDVKKEALFQIQRRASTAIMNKMR